jgi:hypothetical protein
MELFILVSVGLGLLGLVIWFMVRNDKVDDSNGYNDDKPAAMWTTSTATVVVGGDVPPFPAPSSNNVAFVPEDKPYEAFEVSSAKRKSRKPTVKATKKAVKKKTTKK